MKYPTLEEAIEFIRSKGYPISPNPYDNELTDIYHPVAGWKEYSNAKLPSIALDLGWVAEAN